MINVRGLVNKLKLAFTLLASGRYRAVLGALRQRVYSDTHALGLRRDLTIGFDAPSAKIGLHIRPLVASDVDPLLAVDELDLTDDFVVQRNLQSWLLEAGIGTCYVAVSDDGDLCYMQLLIGASENAQIQHHFGGLMPMLQPDVALLEGAYTSPRHRGQRIMPAAMAHIAERATDLGARYVITFVNEDNIPSLKGCERAGFTPYTRRTKRHRLFRRSVTFTPLPADVPAS